MQPHDYLSDMPMLVQTAFSRLQPHDLSCIFGRLRWQCDFGTADGERGTPSCACCEIQPWCLIEALMLAAQGIDALT
jgi:hypothetical protein